jgi:cell division protein FtsB
MGVPSQVLRLAYALCVGSTDGDMLPPLKSSVSTRLTSGIGRVGEGVFDARRKIATGAAGLLALMMGYHVIFGQNGLNSFRDKRHDEHELKHQVQDLQRENDILRSHVDRLSNDPGAIEHEAREDLHYTRPGEVIYTMPADHK